MWCELAPSVTIGNEQIVEVDMNQPMSFGVQREVQFRFLCPNDIDEVKRLCTEWFPIEYPDTWYQEITSNPKFYSLAATYHSRIIGIIVVEVKQLANTNKEDADILASYNSSSCQVAYILSLGVVVDYRKHGIGIHCRYFSQNSLWLGCFWVIPIRFWHYKMWWKCFEIKISVSITSFTFFGYFAVIWRKANFFSDLTEDQCLAAASLLLDSLISYLTAKDRYNCKAIYLHVLATNCVAIKFYEKRRFKVHSFLPYYYSIQGKPRDGYLYVLYINGGKPPWSTLDYIMNMGEILMKLQPCALPRQIIRSVRGWFCRLLAGATSD